MHGLKHAACLLFSGQPERHVSGARIKLGFFVTDDDLRYQDQVHRSLFEQVEKTRDLLRTKYLKADISYEGVLRRAMRPGHPPGGNVRLMKETPSVIVSALAQALKFSRSAGRRLTPSSGSVAS